ncbi:MAG TPA: hypothetical protein PKC28_02595 [Bdellovibrionales bacterium]|nr:hypothetical protein [Bdellovibrionales bacterium]
MSHADKIPRYQAFRQLGLELNSQLFRSLSRRTVMEGGRRLGVARGNNFVMDTEDEIAVVADYCIHDLRHDGQNAIDRFLDSHRQGLSSEQFDYLTSLSKAFFSLFVITDTEPGVGINVRDLLSGQDHLIFDVGFSNTADPEYVLASRIFTHESITMTTGSALPVPPSFVAHLIVKATSTPNAKLSFKTTAEVIRELLANGASNKVAYNDVSKNL